MNDLWSFAMALQRESVLRRVQGARCRLEGEEKRLRSAGDVGDVGVCGRNGIWSRAVFSSAVKGGVVSSTKTKVRRAAGRAKELQEPANSGGGQVRLDAWKRAP
jgi:hypothetical protein